jgi:hypothetical protein
MNAAKQEQRIREIAQRLMFTEPGPRAGDVAAIAGPEAASHVQRFLRDGRPRPRPTYGRDPQG